MNIPIQELIDAITALTAATERNSAIAQKALDLHLSAASHLPTVTVTQAPNGIEAVKEAVTAAVGKKRTKKGEVETTFAIVTEEANTPEFRKEVTQTIVEVMSEPVVEETPVTLEPEPIREPEAPGVTDPALLPKEPYPQPPVTVETIRAYIGQYMLPVTNVTGEALEAAQANNAAVTAKVKEINAEFGATRIPDVPTERLAEYLTVIKRWIPLNK